MYQLSPKAKNISIHALLAESDTPRVLRHCTTYLFLSTLSLRRATTVTPMVTPPSYISIHALLAESDRHLLRYLYQDQHFYPRSPCGERLDTMSQPGCATLFLSTLSLRRATKCRPYEAQAQANFYPRSPCGERRGCSGRCRCWVYFYPRSPCGERRHTGQQSAV